jgi:general secretion pathway protein D
MVFAGAAAFDRAQAQQPAPQAPALPPGVPAGAVPSGPGVYRYIDPQGKHWIYRATPFSVVKLEDTESAAPAPATPAAPAAQTPPATPPATPAAAAPAPQTQTPPPAPAPAPQTTAAAQPPLANEQAFMFPSPGVGLSEMVEILAKRLKISYILDPRVKGSVIISTYGEVRPTDLMQLLQTILRINGASMVQVGDLYRIVPANAVSPLPLAPQVNVDPRTLPDDERMVLNLIFLKYATASEIESLIVPFLGEGAGHSTYAAANLLILQDNSRNMKRTMELIGLFDSDTFAGQRVRLFDVKNSRPSDLAKELESVFKAYALSEKAAPVRFIPVDRIGTLIAVAPNPGIFVEVNNWIGKLDIPPKPTASEFHPFVYRLRYGRAETVAMAIMALYTGNIGALIALSQQMNSSMMQRGMGYNSPGGYTGGGYGGGGYAGGGFGGGGYGLGQYNGFNPYGGGANPMANMGSIFSSPTASVTGAQPGTPGATGPGLTGQFLGSPTGGGQTTGSIPHVVPNPFDNTLLVQGTTEQIEQIKDLLQQLDVAPRQVLIDAKIYEVDLDNEFSAGMNALLDKKDASGTSRTLTATSGAAGLNLSWGALVLRAHELLTTLQASENRGRSRVISAPSIIATDSIPATMNVGDQIPVITSQALVGGVTSNGTSPFANTVSSQSSGVTLSITAHVNSSGIVTMEIDQSVQAPEQAPAGSAIQSPSFSNRSIATQITVSDGDTIAIGGAITETHTESTGGVPVLNRIPGLGFLFGTKNYSTKRTELIIFLTPRVIYDSNQLTEATDEIRTNLKRIQKLSKDQ